jgi:hypothetical protein
MFYESRPHAIAALDDAGELAEKLFEMTWCGCQVFNLGGILFVNDSTGPDGAQSYAVLVTHQADAPAGGVEIDNLTVGWMQSVEDVLEAIVASARANDAPSAGYEGTFSGAPAIALTSMARSVDRAPYKTLNPHENGACRLCA